jgi:hypothetical protein
MSRWSSMFTSTAEDASAPSATTRGTRQFHRRHRVERQLRPAALALSQTRIDITQRAIEVGYSVEHSPSVLRGSTWLAHGRGRIISSPRSDVGWRRPGRTAPTATVAQSKTWLKCSTTLKPISSDVSPVERCGMFLRVRTGHRVSHCSAKRRLTRRNYRLAAHVSIRRPERRPPQKGWEASSKNGPNSRQNIPRAVATTA